MYVRILKMEYLRTNRHNSGPRIYLHLMYDTVYFKPPFGITGPCTLLVNAQYKDSGLRDKCDTMPLYILSARNEDTVPPVVTIKSPSASNTRIQSLPLIIQIACSDENGIDSVQCIFKGEKCTVSKSQDSLYSVEITALTAGKRDTTHFTVTDRSTNHNAATF